VQRYAKETEDRSVMFPQSGGSGGRTLAEVGEFALIDEITAGLPTRPDVLVGPGDDGAVVAVDSPLVCSVDVLVEGVHFKTQWSPAESVGRKAVAVNVADIEAMGGTATGVVVGFAAPGETPEVWALDFARGLRAECERAGVALLGGDVTRSAQIAISVTVLGTLDGRVPVRRNGARPGDVVALCGRVGWAAAGLAVLGRGFRSPRAAVQAQQVPEVPYGQGRIAALAGASSMIDISDGLLADLGHIADLSGVAIDVHRNAFEIAEPLQAVAAATGSDPYKLLLTGGEDHALAATFAPDAVPDGWSVIGAVSPADPAPGVTVDGARWDEDRGWDHYA
jgi:thiamine-monophosphate kinase